jgi:predicted chitinase
MTLPAFLLLALVALCAFFKSHACASDIDIELKPSDRQTGGEWSACSSNRGTCIDIASHSCTTATLTGLCPGGTSIQCCPAAGGIATSTCTAAGGLCKRTDTCTGTSGGLSCPGPSFVQCCTIAKLPTQTPVETPPQDTSSGTYLPPAPSASKSTGECTTPIDKYSGVCVPTSACTGGTFNGLCKGSSKCCVAETRSVPKPSSKPLVSLESFKRLFENISPTRAAALWPYLLDALTYSDVNTCKRIAAFVAQVGHESAGLLYFEEVASGHAYEGRKDLGNTQPGDGRRYKGRGPIQLTGRANYRSAGEALHRDFEAHPEQVCMPSGGFLATAHFWKSHGLNKYADNGDFITLTRRINGGTNGLSDRQQRWSRARAELKC